MVAICPSFHGFNGSMVLSRLEALKQSFFWWHNPFQIFGDNILNVCFISGSKPCTLYLFQVSLKVFTTSMYMGIFGSGSPKRHRLLSNDEELLTKIHAKAGYMSRMDQQNCSTQLVKKYIDKNGRLRCVGLKEELRESAHLVVHSFPQKYAGSLFKFTYVINMYVLTYQGYNESGDSCCVFPASEALPSSFW